MWAAEDADIARAALARLVAATEPGSGWIEAARLGFVLGEDASARRWIHSACLGSADDLAPEPEPLERCGIAALDAAPELPRLPAPIEDLFTSVRALRDLPRPRAPWVAVVGEIDRVLIASDVDEQDPSESVQSVEERLEPARAFLAALRAARRSRERDGQRAPGRCSDRELRARRRMQRIAPALLERYLHGLERTLI